MTSVALSTVLLPAATLGTDSPLPPLRPLLDPHPGLDARIADPGMRANLGYGHATSLLPYTVQDGYGRQRVPRELTTAVVENGVLRAEFLLSYGGRLWSLVHLPTGRELLHRNPILQPANLALRNAWFAGGVEWNIGTTGHSPLTCSPVHAALVRHADGTPVLRMYEFERMRELVFQIDAWLPAGSPALLVHVRVLNPNRRDTPLYWWSNTAVPQTPGTRVVVPADSAYHVSDDGVLRRIGVPVENGKDGTYPGRAPDATEYFYDIPDGQRRYIAALGATGAGLVQTSTGRLRGRKMFRWGTGTGGQNWQDWLSGPSGRYLEIQAGVAATQLEHLRMPAGAAWSWVEAYAAGQVDPDRVHGSDWAASRAAVEEALRALVPPARLDAELAATASWATAAPQERMHRGTGWGALTRRLRERAGDGSLNLPGTPFGDDTLGRDQDPWLALLRTGAMPRPAPSRPPTSYAVGEDWRVLLRASAAASGDNWFTWLHLGVNLHHAGDLAGARDAWRRSLAAEPNPWALRNLAVLDALAGDAATAARRLGPAQAAAPQIRALTIEALEALLAAGRGGDALDLVDRLDPADRRHGRIRLLECRAALAAGDLARAGDLLDAGIVVDDLREGEDSLDELWWLFHEKRVVEGRDGLDSAERRRIREEYPLPGRYNYRMREAG